MLDGVRAALEEMLNAQSIKATVTATPFTDIKVGKVTAMSFFITAPQVVIGDLHLDPASPALDPKAAGDPRQTVRRAVRL